MTPSYCFVAHKPPHKHVNYSTDCTQCTFQSKVSNAIIFWPKSSLTQKKNHRYSRWTVEMFPLQNIHSYITLQIIWCHAPLSFFTLITQTHHFSQGRALVMLLHFSPQWDLNRNGTTCWKNGLINGPRRMDPIGSGDHLTPLVPSMGKCPEIWLNNDPFNGNQLLFIF